MSWSPSTGNNGRAEPRRRNGRDRAPQEAGVARRVEIGAVVERIRVARELHAEVAPRAAPRPHEPTAAARAAPAPARCAGRCRSGRRPGSRASGLSRLIDRAARSARTCTVSVSWGRNVDSNGAPRRSRKGHRAGEEASSTWASVTCASVASTRDTGRPGSELGAHDQWLTRSAERSVPVP